MWDGGDVWIIGGGPSVAEQFNIPAEVVQSVFSGAEPLSAYSPYMKAIHDKHVIAINVAFRIGDWIDMVFFGDGGFYLANKVALAKFPGLKVSCHSHVCKDNWVKFLARDGKKPRGISSTPYLVSWNGNSGAAAVSVAVHAGAKRVILLGFDMKLNNSNQQHYHNAYGRGIINIQDPHKRRKLPFDRHLRGFPIIAQDAGRMGIEIINASPESVISCFRKMTVKEIIDECDKTNGGTR